MQFRQKLPLALEECWNFFSNPQNLKSITPPYLGFSIQNGDPESSVYAGQIISYTVSPMLKIPITWVTEITHVEKPHLFIDVQLVGPYRLWYHEHRFVAIPSGVLVQDTINYKLPLGPIGSVVNSLKIKKQVEGIFEFRRKVLEDKFGVLE